MGICVAREAPDSVSTETVAKSATPSALHPASLKESQRVLASETVPSLHSDAPFAGYDAHVWSDLQRHNREAAARARPDDVCHSAGDAASAAAAARAMAATQVQRSSSIAVLKRISLQRLSMMSEKVSLLDDLRPKPRDDAKSLSVSSPNSSSSFSIGSRGRRLSSTLNEVYSQLSDVTARREGEGKEEYLKRVFSIVDHGKRGRVSSMDLADTLFNDARSASTAVMMAAADHDKDGFLTESDFVSFFIHVESGEDCLQADRNEARPTTSNSSSGSEDGRPDPFATLASSDIKGLAARHSLPANAVRMRGVQVTNLCSQSSRIKCIALSPDGMLYAVAHRHDNVAHLYSMSDGAEVRRLIGHQGSLLGITFSPDRKHVVTAARDNYMVSWDRTVGLECSFAEHPGIVTAVAVSCDGKFVFSGCQDNLVRKATTSKAKVRAVLPDIPCETPGVIVALATQNTTSEVIAFSRSCDRCAYVANAHSLQLIAKLSGHESLVWQTSFNADDTMLLTCCERKIIVWNGATFSSVNVFHSATVVTSPGSYAAEEVLWTTAVFAAMEHRNLLFCFNSVGQMHVVNYARDKEESIMDVQLRSSVYTASTFAGDTMVCGDDFGNVYRVCIN